MKHFDLHLLSESLYMLAYTILYLVHSKLHWKPDGYRINQVVQVI